MCNCEQSVVVKVEEEPVVERTSLLAAPIKFMKSAATHIMSGEKTPLKNHDERMKICEVCPENLGGMCGICKCVLFIKASWKEQECPLGKWPQIT